MPLLLDCACFGGFSEFRTVLLPFSKILTKFGRLSSAATVCPGQGLAAPHDVLPDRCWQSSDRKDTRRRWLVLSSLSLAETCRFCFANVPLCDDQSLRSERPVRLLFSSIHSYLDPSGGAAMATRELLELLTAAGMDCRAFCAGVLDDERETSLDEMLASLGLAASRVQAELGGGHSAEVIDLTVGDGKGDGHSANLTMRQSSRHEKQATSPFRLPVPVSAPPPGWLSAAVRTRLLMQHSLARCPARTTCGVASRFGTP